jgi:hypothetical protein
MSPPLQALVRQRLSPTPTGGAASARQPHNQLQARRASRVDPILALHSD